MERMFLLSFLLWNITYIIVIAEFTCPELDSFCSCGEGTNWWGNTWTTVNIVNCSNNALTEIPELSSLIGKTIDRLLLSDNNITKINQQHFHNVFVREIVLRKNPIQRISNDAFFNIRHTLEILDMDSDKINIDEGMPFLKGLYNLKTLDIGCNRIVNKFKVFPAGIFMNLNLSSLTSLTLQALQMTKLDDGAVSGIENLEQLDLSKNFISEFPQELLKLKKLKGLKLYSNELATLKNNSFTHLSQLQKLLLGVNDIENIEDGAFNDLEDSVEEINLFNNPLNKVPSVALSKLRKLKKLSFVKTNIESIENGSFVGEYKLKELYLGDNPNLQFEDEGMFNGIEDHLEVLHIPLLKLEKLPNNILSRLKKLYTLDASENAFTKIDKNFFKGLRLSDVRLAKNKIEHVDNRAFKGFGKNVILNLNNNKITDISFILEVEACTFNEIYIESKAIPCDCNVEKVLNSGLVGWKVFGQCYVEVQKDTTRWYSFNDPSLMDYLHIACNRTKQYSACRQSVSSASYWKMTFMYNVVYISIVFILLYTSVLVQ